MAQIELFLFKFQHITYIYSFIFINYFYKTTAKCAELYIIPNRYKIDFSIAILN